MISSPLACWAGAVAQHAGFSHKPLLLLRHLLCSCSDRFTGSIILAQRYPPQPGCPRYLSISLSSSQVQPVTKNCLWLQFSHRKGFDFSQIIRENEPGKFQGLKPKNFKKLLLIVTKGVIPPVFARAENTFAWHRYCSQAIRCPTVGLAFKL